MIKKISISLFFIILTISTVYAQSDINLILNYGATETEESKVIVSFSSMNIDDYKGYKVQFSFDGVNWEGYDMAANEWKWHYAGDFLEYYPDLNLGTDLGTKNIKAKLINSNGEEIILKSSIKYINKKIEMPNEKYLQTMDSDVYDGVGNFSNPYLVRSKYVKIDKNLGNAKYIKYSTNKSWSKWYRIYTGKADVTVTLPNSDLNEVYYITKDKNGIESTVQTIYYSLDNAKPKIKLSTEFHELIAIDGKISFDAGFYDESSDKIEYEVVINAFGKKKQIKGYTDLYEKGYFTYITFDIQNLPKGTLELELIAKDKAGNKLIKKYDIYSY